MMMTSRPFRVTGDACNVAEGRAIKLNSILEAVTFLTLIHLGQHLMGIFTVNRLVLNWSKIQNETFHLLGK